MTKDEVARRLRTMHDKANDVLALLETRPFTGFAAVESQSISQSLQKELMNEYRRMGQVEAQAAMAIIEARFYRPAVEEAALGTFGKLPTHNVGCSEWYEAIEEVRVAMDYHLRQLEAAGAHR